MVVQRLLSRVGVICLLAAMPVGLSAHAQNYPAGPVKFITQLAAGGGTDPAMRSHRCAPQPGVRRRRTTWAAGQFPVLGAARRRHGGGAAKPRHHHCHRPSRQNVGSANHAGQSTWRRGRYCRARRCFCRSRWLYSVHGDCVDVHIPAGASAQSSL